MKRLILSKNRKKTIKKTTQLIKKGKVLVCPTDTVYGLVCDAKNKKAIRKLFNLKKRPSRKPIPIFVKNIKMAKQYAYINKKQANFLKKIWPGKVTVVLKKKKGLPKILFGNKKTIGLRIPKYKIINQLLSATNRPLTGTSANLSGCPHSPKIKEIVKQFENKKLQPDLVVDVGNLKPSRPSTIVDLSGSKLKIIRAGAVRKEKLIKIFQ